MKKVLILALVVGFLSACAYNAKQPQDDTYYKKTQGIAWPEEENVAVQSTSKTAVKASSSSFCVQIVLFS